MRGLGGLILLTGIGVALFVYLPTPVDSGASLDRLQGIVASRFAQLPRSKVTRLSPGRVLAFHRSVVAWPKRVASCGPRYHGSSRTSIGAVTSAHCQRHGLADDRLDYNPGAGRAYAT